MLVMINAMVGRLVGPQMLARLMPSGPACAGLAADHAHAAFYVCGPGPFMVVVGAGPAELMVPPDRIPSAGYATESS